MQGHPAGRARPTSREREREREREYVMTRQSQFIEKSFKKTENFEHSVVLLVFLFTLGKRRIVTLDWLGL